MKRIGLFVALALVASAFILSTAWKAIDKENIKVNFELIGEGTKGTFTGVETDIKFDINDLSQSSITATIQTGSVDTGNERRDEHLKQADFFDAEKFPTITFVSSEITATESGYLAKGNLTMKGQTHPVEVPFEFTQEEDGKATFKGKMSVIPYKFGVISNKKGAEQQVDVNVEIPLSR